ncbi:MAG TPA: 50S ribosomal protein L15, partial [Pseudomonas sp.]|nr:50S ribosomal protein L15 [Pseudomonas sp.]
EVGRAVTLKGITATKGARAAIEAAGGKFEE